MPTICGYEIKKIINQTPKYIFYEGIRQQDGIPVLIKVPSSECPSVSEFAYLRHEYEITKDPGLNGVIKSISLEEYDKGMALILEDMPNASPLSNVLLNLDFETFLAIGVSLAQKLSTLHKKNIIHKDLNPGHIFVDLTTAEAKLTGLGIASIFPLENPDLISSSVIEGNLSYISPEQSGRMNRSIDYRSDFYSLGVTFYEALTGVLPFQNSDPSELLHCHMAKVPIAPHKINPDIPRAVSALTMRLMAKIPEDRYQSALGLKNDLKKCLKQLRTFGRIENFPVGRHDVSDKFQITQRLYGREQETEKLLSVYEEVAAGKTKIMMVAGYAGIGKTSFVQQINKSIVQRGGYYISGKFDQFYRDVPYSAMVHAFQDLVRQLLTESEKKLDHWKEKLSKALGPHAKIIIDVIPEVELVIGPQPEVQELGPVESQNRFMTIFLDFIRVFCTVEHSLVIFLDDLHWIDTATLKLINFIVSEQTTQYLLLIGAYRDKEIDSHHPLLTILDKLRAHDEHIDEIILGPLGTEETAELLEHTLSSDRESVRPLAELILSKTAGNPFFLKQFLLSLCEHKLIVFDTHKGCWLWEIQQIKNSEMTDNVADLLVSKIMKLTEETQFSLKLAACIGNQFDLKTLAIVNEETSAKTFDSLYPALSEGLIVRVSFFGFSVADSEKKVSGKQQEFDFTNPVFKFCHDRVQQAAYSLMQGLQKKEVHLRIGRLILSNVAQDELVETSFSTVHHLNYAYDLITEESEKIVLAELNLMAGKKAKASSAYEPALRYLTMGTDLLDDKSWTESYPLTLGLYMHRAEAEYLNGHFEVSERLVDLILNHARSVVEQAEVYRILIVQFTMLASYKKAYEVGQKALGLLGISTPDQGQAGIQLMLDQLIDEINKKISGRLVSSLIDGPELNNADIKIAVKLLSDMLPLAFFLDLSIFSYLTVILVDISLQYGNTPESAYGFACYGRLLITRGEYQSGDEFGRLAMRLSEKYNNLGQKSRCYNSFANFIQLWRKHIRTTNDLNIEGYQSGIQSGEFQFAGYCVSNLLFNHFYQGTNLKTILELSTEYELFVLKTKSQISSGSVTAVRWTIQNLVDFPKYDNESMDLATWLERQLLRELEFNDSSMVLCHSQIYLAQLLYLYGEPKQALRHILRASKILDYVVGSVICANHNFYYSLILIALYPEMSRNDKLNIMDQVKENQLQMKIWSDNCEDNFLHKYLLVKAEIARLTGNDSSASELYDQSIERARNTKFLQDEALANELAAQFWLLKEDEATAEIYLKKSQSAYQLWGAKGKLKFLDKKYFHLLYGNHKLSTTKEGTHLDLLDLSTIMKASQTISGEIKLDKLLTKLTRILIENAGAQRGCLLLKSGDELLIEAEGDLENNEIQVLQSVSLQEGGNVSPEIVQYVARTHEYVVLDNASRDGMFAADVYIRSHNSKSIVCGPILHKSALLGIFYLENTLINGAFTTERIEVLKLLAGTIAISIENARLYSDLENQADKLKTFNSQLNREIQERKKAEEKYRSIFENALEGIFQATPEGRFISANPALAGIYGYDSPGELINSIKDIGKQLYVQPRYREMLNALMRENRKAVSGFEVEVYRKDGSKIWTSIHARPIYDENGKFVLIEGILTDITKSKREAEALREREEYLQKENRRLRSNIKDRYKFGNIIGKSVAMQVIYDLILKASASDANVIVYGESGTGKELVSRAIHDMSDRKNNAFVSLNCGAIPENLLESELFGYKKGAFTGASMDKRGYLELADGGTLFLDELGEISPNMQVKLLRVLEGQGFTPVGDTIIKNPDVRIIAATHRNLQEQVRKGLMREDFFFRIHVIPIRIPPLRERIEDLSLLIDHFQKIYGKNLPNSQIPGKVIEALHGYHWPGNVRELQNTLQRYFMLEKLDFMGTPLQKHNNPTEEHLEEPTEKSNLLQTAMKEFEKKHILNVLTRNRWQKAKTASILGINRKTLFQKIKHHKLEDSL